MGPFFGRLTSGAFVKSISFTTSPLSFTVSLSLWLIMALAESEFPDCHAMS